METYRKAPPFPAKLIIAIAAMVWSGGLSRVYAQQANVQQANAQALIIGRRPSFPYRVWYAGNYVKNPEWYSHMTMDGSGKGDPRMQEARGVSHLNWVYGTQISWKAGPQYWIEHAGEKRRTAKPNEQYPYPFLVGGYSVDEWTGSTEEKRQWVVAGLREAKKQNPELFIAMWVAGVDKHVAALARDGIVDLIIVQAYNLTVQRGIGVSWQTGLDRMDVARKEGLESKTLFAFGHVTSDANWKGGFVWTEERIRQQMAELKARYPKMPGIAFFEAGAKDHDAHGKVVQLFDRLSAEYWPDSLPLDGTFSLTPQSATKMRLRHASNLTEAQVVIGESDLSRAQLWNFVPLGEDAYKIQAPYDASLVLTAVGDSAVSDSAVALQRDTNSAAQKWMLSKVTGGYTIGPASASQVRLDASQSGVVRLSPAETSAAQTWALAPEYLPPPPGTAVITTNQGAGADATIMPNATLGRQSRLGIRNDTNLSGARKAYLRFDLAAAPEPVVRLAFAKLTLTIAKVLDNSPPDKVWTFKVYGLKD
ncbi:MAG: RICIN domain-containing protein, partial [Armatimonadota bacterium]|nr:RICIN domain-containing protein [Armatimonadota bacterium]